jgi:hypothetical protein
MYLSENSKLAKSPNRFSKTDLVTAIVAKQIKNKSVTQSELSDNRG